MRKNTAQTLHWLIGGIIGVLAGLAYSFRIIFNADLPLPDMYNSAIHVCALIIIVSVALGAAFGVIIGKILLMLREIYSKNPKNGKKK